MEEKKSGVSKKTLKIIIIVLVTFVLLVCGLCACCFGSIGYLDLDTQGRGGCIYIGPFSSYDGC
ncbi:hypothetical protein JW766_01350 [Candidatus Dojkabacteria bacterium]|nr:hypothetical protein [Candidatus Dojkabacteria bacterium]